MFINFYENIFIPNVFIIRLLPLVCKSIFDNLSIFSIKKSITNRTTFCHYFVKNIYLTNRNFYNVNLVNEMIR